MEMYKSVYDRIEEAIRYMEENFRERPSLEETAGKAGMSKFHFSRLFREWAGISPSRFMNFLTLEYTRKQLDKSRSLLESSLDAGLSGPGRLHDLFVTITAMSPGEYKNRGQGLVMDYGFSESPFGLCFIASTQRGICHMGFTAEAGKKEYLNSFFSEWKNAEFKENTQKAEQICRAVFYKMGENDPEQKFILHVKGTNFQINVWKALLAIPQGNLISYSSFTEKMGKGKAVRAVSSAVAANRVAYLIPCHRVISKSGAFNEYRWGSERKRIIAGWDASQTSVENVEG